MTEVRWRHLIDWITSSSAQRRIVTVANLGALLLLTYTLAQVTWLLVPLPELAESTATKASVTPASISRGDGDYGAKIAKYHLFGKQKKKVAATPAPVKAPVTRLNLTLKGVVASDIPERARALIAEGREREKSYAIGTNLPGNGVLKEIHADYVLLERNRQLERLQMVRPEGTGTVSSVGASGREPFVQGNAPQSSSPAGKPQPRTLREYRDEFTSNPGAIIEHVRATPVYKDGRMQGVRLRTIKDRTLLRRHGLRKNDIITAVNGINIDSEMKGFEIMQNLRETERINVEITRNGRPQNMVINLDQ